MTSSFFAAICAAFKDYDIVHFHAEGPCAALWIPKLFGKKCVCTIHGIDWQREKWKVVLDQIHKVWGKNSCEICR